MEHKQNGFGVLWLLLVIVILVVAGAAMAVNKKSSNPKAANKNVKGGSKELLYLKSIGFNLDNYDPATNRAGDMVFTHVDNNLSNAYHLIFADFGTQDPRSPNDPTKRNVQPTFILPLGTKVQSLVTGVVANVEELYSGDFTVQITLDGKMNSYIYETEHVSKPAVKKGDKVTAGQIIGEVSPHDSQYHPGFGILEIGILHSENCTQAQHVCPFRYLDPSVKTDIQNRILNVHKAWMDFTGLPNLYNDAAAAEPGCFTTDPVNG